VGDEKKRKYKFFRHLKGSSCSKLFGALEEKELRGLV